jgi:hypothetical protein
MNYVPDREFLPNQLRTQLSTVFHSNILNESTRRFYETLRSSHSHVIMQQQVVLRKKKTKEEREEDRRAMYGDFSKSSWYRALHSIVSGYPVGLNGRHPYLLHEERVLLLQQIRLRTLTHQSPTNINFCEILLGFGNKEQVAS